MTHSVPGQKFPIGAKVFIKPKLDGSRSHFRSGTYATVKYTYAYVYGGTNFDEYCITFSNGSNSAWYHEKDLIDANDENLIQQCIEECRYYVVGDKDILTATSPEEALTEFIEDCSCNETEDLPEYVEVEEYERLAIPEDSNIFSSALERLVEDLEENYGSWESCIQYSMSDEARELFNTFKKQVISEFHVHTLVPTGVKIKFKVEDYL